MFTAVLDALVCKVTLSVNVYNMSKSALNSRKNK